MKKIHNENADGISSKAVKQRALLDYWLPFLTEMQEIELVWLEGSMVNAERENPGSDIDIRFAIADTCYDELWGLNGEKIFAPLGEVLPLERNSFITEQGILIEFSAHKTSEVIGKKVFEWEFLINRLPKGQPGFISPPGWLAHEKWPYNDKVTLSDFIDSTTKLLMRRLSVASTPFYYEEAHSAQRSLDALKLSLLNVQYYRHGVRPYMRANHLQQIFTPEALAQYEYIQFQKNENSFDHSAIAKATLRTFDVLIKNLKEMYEQAGIEAPDKWIQVLYQKTEEELQKFI